MDLTAHIAKMARETCTCGAVYEVAFYHAVIPDTRYEDCVSCGRRLASWNSQTTWPEYTLTSLADDDNQASQGSWDFSEAAELVIDVAVVLRLVLMMEHVECRQR